MNAQNLILTLKVPFSFDTCVHVHECAAAILSKLDRVY